MSDDEMCNDEIRDDEQITSVEPGGSAFWEAHYRAMSPQWGTEPNPALRETLGRIDHDPRETGRTRALDLGAGHGGDACWLASRGWEVTAVDVSPTALGRVEAEAAARGLAGRVRTEAHDLTESLPAGEFGLVTASYLHLGEGRPEILRQAWSRLTLGGLLVVIDHASAPPWSWADPGARFPTPRETLDELGLNTVEEQERLVHVEHLAAVPRQATGPGGETAEVVDNVIVVRSTTGPVVDLGDSTDVD